MKCQTPDLSEALSSFRVRFGSRANRRPTSASSGLFLGAKMCQLCLLLTIPDPAGQDAHLQHIYQRKNQRTRRDFASTRITSNTSTTSHPGRCPRKQVTSRMTFLLPLRDFSIRQNIYCRQNPNLRLHAAPTAAHGGPAKSSKRSKNPPRRRAARCGGDRPSPHASTWRIRRQHPHQRLCCRQHHHLARLHQNLRPTKKKPTSTNDHLRPRPSFMASSKEGLPSGPPTVTPVEDWNADRRSTSSRLAAETLSVRVRPSWKNKRRHVPLDHLPREERFRSITVMPRARTLLLTPRSRLPKASNGFRWNRQSVLDCSHA